MLYKETFLKKYAAVCGKKLTYYTQWIYQKNLRTEKMLILTKNYF